MADYVTKDSGNREDFETGSRRDTQEGKPRFDLIGIELMERLAGLMARGAVKYGENNWREGQPATRYYASAFRHLMQWAMGDDSEDHLAAVAFNVGGLMHIEDKMPEMCDHERYSEDLDRQTAIARQLLLSHIKKVVYKGSGLIAPFTTTRDIMECMPNGLRGMSQEVIEVHLRALCSMGELHYNERADVWYLTP